MQRVSIRISEDDILQNIPRFPTHTEYIKYRFAKDKGIMVYDTKQLFTLRSSSDRYLLLEFVATVGNGCADRADEALKLVEKYDGKATRNIILD